MSAPSPSTAKSDAPPSPSTAKSDARGDIVSEYLWLVLPFAFFNLVSWILALLEVLGVVGPAGYAAMDALYPVDISFCQMMFWGTLHFGAISDGRLSLICRVAFVIEAACYVIRNFVIFHAFTIEDALDFANETVSSGASAGVPPLSMNMGILRASLYFVVFGPFAAWVGTSCLQVGRRRLLANVSAAELPAFSTRFLRGYVLVLAAQLGLCALSTVLTATAATAEALLLQTKRNTVLRSASGILAQVLGWKAVIFDASGKTLAMWRAGQGTRLQTAAVVCVFLFIFVVSFDLVLMLCVTATTSPLVLYVHNVIVETGLENGPMMGIWLFALINFGISLMHLHPLKDVDTVDEAFLEKRKAVSAPKKQPPVSTEMCSSAPTAQVKLDVLEA